MRVKVPAGEERSGRDEENGDGRYPPDFCGRVVGELVF